MLPSPLPTSWLKVRLLPSELLPMADLPARYEAWLRARGQGAASGAERPPSPPRPDDVPCLYFDDATGRVSLQPLCSDPLELLFADLLEFTRLNHASPLARWRPGDELWRFSSSAESWRHLAGRAGFVWLRGGRTLRVFCTVIN